MKRFEYSATDERGYTVRLLRSAGVAISPVFLMLATAAVVRQWNVLILSCFLIAGIWFAFARRERYFITSLSIDKKVSISWRKGARDYSLTDDPQYFTYEVNTMSLRFREIAYVRIYYKGRLVASQYENRTWPANKINALKKLQLPGHYDPHSAWQMMRDDIRLLFRDPWQNQRT
jgi:hypothetical protein